MRYNTTKNSILVNINDKYMNKVIVLTLLSSLLMTGTAFAEEPATQPKKKTSLEKRMKKQNKKKKKKGDTACPKIDC